MNEQECPFCKKHVSELTREHIYPRWLIKLINVNKT